MLSQGSRYREECLEGFRQYVGVSLTQDNGKGNNRYLWAVRGQEFYRSGQKSSKRGYEEKGNWERVVLEGGAAQFG